MPPDLALWLKLIISSYPCLQHIFMIPKVFEQLKFYCMWLSVCFHWRLSPIKIEHTFKGKHFSVKCRNPFPPDWTLLRTDTMLPLKVYPSTVKLHFRGKQLLFSFLHPISLGVNFHRSNFFSFTSRHYFERASLTRKSCSTLQKWQKKECCTDTP